MKIQPKCKDKGTYEKYRASIRCQICNEKAYRKRLCRHCYKVENKNTFHCTVKNCVCPVFALTLCQKHYKIMHTKCYFCEKSIHCRNLCRKHYDICRENGKFPMEETCNECNKNVYLNGKCILHFKRQFYASCIIAGCENEKHKKGMCCAHYYRTRRKKK